MREHEISTRGLYKVPNTTRYQKSVQLENIREANKRTEFAIVGLGNLTLFGRSSTKIFVKYIFARHEIRYWNAI